MCFSEELSKEAGGYQTESGWVLIGWKVVLRLGPFLMPWYPMEQQELFRAPIGIDPRESNSAARAMANAHQLLSAVSNAMRGYGDVAVPIFHPRQLLTDFGHGFHVASSPESAMEHGNPFGCEVVNRPVCHSPAVRLTKYDPSKGISEFIHVRLRQERRVCEPGALVKVLVPSLAVTGDNHVRAMVVIPPDQKETEADIKLADDFNKRVFGCMKKIPAAKPTAFREPAKV